MEKKHKAFYRKDIDIKIYNNKKAIFNNKNIQISKWWKNIYLDGFINNLKSSYYIVQNDNNKEAIFHKNNKNNPISKWFDIILYMTLDDEEFNFYIGQNKNNKAFYKLDNKDIPIIENVYDFKAESVPIDINNNYYVFSGNINKNNKLIEFRKNILVLK